MRALFAGVQRNEPHSVLCVLCVPDQVRTLFLWFHRRCEEEPECQQADGPRGPPAPALAPRRPKSALVARRTPEKEAQKLRDLKPAAAATRCDTEGKERVRVFPRCDAGARSRGATLSGAVASRSHPDGRQREREREREGRGMNSYLKLQFFRL